jgi:hypothetical protein
MVSLIWVWVEKERKREQGSRHPISEEQTKKRKSGRRSFRNEHSNSIEWLGLTVAVVGVEDEEKGKDQGSSREAQKRKKEKESERTV